MKVIILGHSNPDVDSIISGYLLEKYMNKSSSIKYEFVIPDLIIEKENMDIVTKLGIDITKYQERTIEEEDKIILVDHYSDNRFPNEVIGVIDHHPVTEKDYIKPSIFYHNKASCSTSASLAELYNIKDKEDFRIALIGALVDTASFHSTKTNQEQAKWLKKRAIELGIDYDQCYDIGLCLTDMEDINKTYLNGLKKYLIEGRTVESSYIQVKKPKERDIEIKQILDLIEQYRIEKNIDYFVFIVHDMAQFKTRTYTLSNDGIEIEDYDNYTSRGNTIIPRLKERLENNNSLKKAPK